MTNSKKSPPRLTHGVTDYMRDDQGRVIFTVPVAGLEQHPLGKLFPLDTDEKLDELAADIKERGQLDPIVLAGVHGETTSRGKVLEGNNRVEAIKRAGLQHVAVLVFRGTAEEQLAFVKAKNFLRRDLTTGQRAMIAAEWQT